MAELLFFKAGEGVEKYGDSAKNYTAGQKVFIIRAADKVGMSQISTAIAGAMAEENDGYNIVLDWMLDKYALSGLTVADLGGITASSLSAGWNAPLIAIVTAALEMNSTSRTHAEWQDLYNEIAGDEKPSDYEKNN